MRAVRRAGLGKAQRIGRYPCRVRAADGTWRHVQSTVSRYIDPGHPDRLLLTARDLSAQVALSRQVTHLTFHDGLTGLPNRAYVEQRGQDVLSHAGALAGPGTVAGVILLDMDGFTAINEECGHTAGDLLLAQVARRLRLAVSPQDTVARWGGDEFAVLTESAASAEELAEIAERLSRSVASQPFRIGEADLAITASVGVAIADGGPAAHVWRNAEMALARAKGSGAGQVEVFGRGTGEASADEMGIAGTGTGELEAARDKRFRGRCRADQRGRARRSRARAGGQHGRRDRGDPRGSRSLTGRWRSPKLQAVPADGAGGAEGVKHARPAHLISRDETVLRLTDLTPWTTVDYVLGAHIIVLARRADR